MNRDGFLQLVYERFRTASAWPLVRDLQVALRPVNVRLLAAEIGIDTVVCEETADGVCFLRLEGLACCPNAKEDIETFLAAIRFIAQQFIKDGTASVTAKALADNLGLSAEALRRLGLILSRTNVCWSTSSWRPDGSAFEVSPSSEAVFYENVNTLEGFLGTRRKVADDAIAAAARRFQPQHRDPPPPSVPRRVASAAASALGYVRQHKIGGLVAAAVGFVTLLTWWQGRVRVTVDVRHYAHGPTSEATIGDLREWVRSHPGRAYDVVDVVWHNKGEVPVSDVTVLAAVPLNAEILTCDLAEPSLRPRIHVERLVNQCAISLDRIAAGSRDSVRIRYRSPVVNWLYQCDLSGWKGDICTIARPSADSGYPLVVTAQSNGPPIPVRTKHTTREWP
jgi:hypothetical protein